MTKSIPESSWLATISQKYAQTRNRTGGPTMATLDFTTKPFARVTFRLGGEHVPYEKICQNCRCSKLKYFMTASRSPSKVIPDSIHCASNFGNRR